MSTEPTSGKAEPSAKRFDEAVGPELTNDEDGPDAGRWVATDESGYDGGLLMGRRDRFMTVGSVAVDDITAAHLIASLRDEAGIRQGNELKFSMFRRTHRETRQVALARMLTASDGLSGQFSWYAIDKHYMAAAKIVSVLIDEFFHAAGFDLNTGGRAREMARALALDGASAIGTERFHAMLDCFVTFVSPRNAHEQIVTVDQLMATFAEAVEVCPPGPVRSIVEFAAMTRTQAQQALDIPDADFPVLEPLIPGLAALLGGWVTRMGSIRVLSDEHIQLPDATLDVIARMSGINIDIPSMEVTRRGESAQVFRGRSQDHPSIQLADLVAGAGLEVGRSEIASQNLLAPELKQVLMDHLDENSLLPHDDRHHLLPLDPFE